ncbi:hypothetical protein GH808_03775 [Acetobacterium fimetarium]|uniref:PPM-type phosphatase domain-containing protein n=1 Tax=Acetobacterium fimetarium TaxID=52691 RepID=A0ABR6WSI6_9FIRM|nr:PP2C family serine/threonine-protein phosphatase [Acetobacterium fimetarium]MBC3803555.1 hypothetical protein [Acetobacterium fimetarium]
MRYEGIGYSSVMGALHTKSRLPNQDSYLVKKLKFGTLLVVSDGMGSHAHAEVGSRAVCRSVSKALQIWNENKCEDIRLLIPLLHSMWNLDIYPFAKNECGATCLFAFVSVEGKVFLGQLGDGSIYFDFGKGTEVLKDKDDDFANLTTGINNIRSFEDWILMTVDAFDKPIKLCLMTDGVSETLIENKRSAFVELIWKRISEKANVIERNNLVYRVLNQWNPVNSGDDRTLISYEKR